jgi:hypothetical protein
MIFSFSCRESALNALYWPIITIYLGGGRVMMLSVLDCIVSNSRMTNQWSYKKDFEGSSTIPVYKYSCRDWGKLQKTSVWIAGIPAEISSKHLRNTSLEHCHCTSLLGHFRSSLQSSSTKFSITQVAHPLCSTRTLRKIVIVYINRKPVHSVTNRQRIISHIIYCEGTSHFGHHKQDNTMNGNTVISK